MQTTIRGMCAGWVRYRRGDEPLLNPQNGVVVADILDGPLSPSLIIKAHRIATFDFFSGLRILLGDPMNPNEVLPRWSWERTLVVVIEDAELPSIMDQIQKVRGPYFTAAEAEQFAHG